MLRHVVRAIRSHWPAVDILIRGDGHYAGPRPWTWLERNRVGYVFGLAGNKVLLGQGRAASPSGAAVGPRGRRRRQGPPLRRVPLRRQDLGRSSGR